MLTLIPTSTFASNHGDKYYSFNLNESNKVGYTKSRAKENSTSTYVHIQKVPGSMIKLDVQGFRPVGTGGSNSWRDETVSGTQLMFTGKWLVRQNVYERGGRSARLKFQKYAANGTLYGYWSPDSVGTYPVVN